MRTSMPKRAPLVLIAALAATALALLAVASGSAASVSSVKGTITTQSVTGPSCTSAVGVCFTGSLSGKLKGTLTGTGTSLIQTVDTPTTAVILLTSDVDLQTADGQITFKDATVLHTTGRGEFSGIWTIVGGTGSYSAVTGAIQVTGTFVVGGTGTGRYEGQLEFP